MTNLRTPLLIKLKMDYYKRLNFHVDIQELQDYYQTLSTTYAHLKWTYEQHKADVSDKWHEIFNSKDGNNLFSGWSIDTNLPDGQVCPPLNESITKTRLDHYRDTELNFGVIKRLRDKIPYATKWAILTQPTGGRVFKHDDRGDYVTHMMIENNSQCVFRFYKSDDEYSDINIPVDGCPYTLNTELKHETWNDGPERISLIFVIKQEDFPKLEALNGKI
jgi:hypothetical protein